MAKGMIGGRGEGRKQMSSWPIGGAMLVRNAATSIFRGNEAVPNSSDPFSSYLESGHCSSYRRSAPETSLGALYIRRCPITPRPTACALSEGPMAEAVTSTASSIAMSSVPSTLGRRDTGLGSAQIGYDEERAEPNSRICVRRRGNRI